MPKTGLFKPTFDCTGVDRHWQFIVSATPIPISPNWFQPHAQILPSLFLARVCVPAVLISTILEIEVCAGEAWHWQPVGSVVPLPISPRTLKPQAKTVPSGLSA